MRRVFDVLLAAVGLVILSPVLLPAMLFVWLQDFHSPFYLAPRVGRNGKPFRMVKLRSMVANADRTGVDSTSAQDPRITPVGRFIRRYKLDEVMQLCNVLTGDMLLVGPRPNVKRETDLYTEVERELLSAEPGVTDFASIVFADEGEILKDAPDPDIAYNQVIRPWKSRLGLFYIERRSPALDIRLLCLTALAIVDRERALRGVAQLLQQLGADPALCRIALRQDRLMPVPPPGSTEVVTTRQATSS
ncbi:MAG TPA: sugar transferase [Burkholderiales bacterium]|nr:sugar transferase [Burkholderiales bacterium]